MTKFAFVAFVALVVAMSPARAEKVYTGDKTITFDCGKDPEVTISTNKAKITLTGTCKGVTLTGGDNTVSIDAVDELVWTGGPNTFTINTVREIVANGNGNTLKIGTLGALTINGDNNSFVWKQAKSGKA